MPRSVLATLGEKPPKAPPAPVAEGDWRVRALATLPAVGAGAGGITGGVLGAGGGALATAPAGGVGGVPGSVAGATFGGAAGGGLGRILENAGRGAMGLPPAQGMVEQIAGGVGHPLPEIARGPLDLIEQMISGGALEGGTAKLFGVPGKAAGSLQEMAAGKSARDTAKRQAEASSRKMAEMVEGDPSKDIASELAKATAAKNASAQEAARLTKDAAQTAQKAAVKTIADKMADMSPQAYGNHAANPLKLTRVVQSLIKKVTKEVHGVEESRVAFDPEGLAHLNETFNMYLRRQRKAAATGQTVIRGPIDKVASAIKAMLYDAVPGVAEQNAKTGAAMEGESALKRASRTAGTETTRRIEAEAEARKAAVRAGARTPEPLLTPGLGSRGLTFHLPSGGQVAGSLADVLARPGVQASAYAVPTQINALLRALLASTGQEEGY